MAISRHEALNLIQGTHLYNSALCVNHQETGHL